MTDYLEPESTDPNASKSIDTKEDLAAELRRLVRAYERRTGKRNKTGLAESLRVSPSSVYAYLKGTTLPPDDVLDQLLVMLQAPAADRRRLADALDELRDRVKTRAEPAELAGSPRELPLDVAEFTGRAEEIAELDRLVTAEGQLPPVVISAVAGTAGVGKTALAVHWAHRARDRFPDGHLYVDLRGFDPDEPMAPAAALASLLRSLGVNSADIPPEQAERAARYRSLLSDRRMLVVLDNAHSAEQVRDLLPGTPSCFVLVTSRDRLTGLVIRHGARRINLDVLTGPDAVALLRALLGDRVDAEPDGVAALAERCVRLPLALRIAAELAAAHPSRTLSDLATELKQHHLDMFGADGDQRTAIRAVFSWSYRHLPADAARMFRQISLHPGTDLDAEAAAALNGSDLPTAGRLLDTLNRGHLIQETTNGRYGQHDLLRIYARELATSTDREPDRRTAQTRLFDYYLAYTAAAADTLHPGRYGRPSLTVTPTPAMSDAATARKWLDTERDNLIATCNYTATHGWPDHVIGLASAIDRYLDSGYRTEAVTIHTHALHASQQTGNRAAQATALINLAAVDWRLGRYTTATQQLREAITLYQHTNDAAGEARALINLGIVEEMQGQLDTAATHYRHALELSREAGNLAGEAHALTNLGDVHNRQGTYDSAADHHSQALTLYQTLDNRTGEADALISLGIVRTSQGDHATAADHLTQALSIHRRLGNKVGEAYALTNLADIQAQTNQLTEATTGYNQAIEIFRAIGERYGETAALNSLGKALHLANHHIDGQLRHTDALAIATETANLEEQAHAHAGLAHTYEAIWRASQIPDRGPNRVPVWNGGWECRNGAGSSRPSLRTRR